MEIQFRIILSTNWNGFKIIRGYDFGVENIKTIYFELGFIQIKLGYISYGN